ncbi:phosphoribosylanthranilate isomerase [Sphingobacterium suaedae]|uniref:N-(5'-phosphoribosyl)anthranilate isomerase n=1 Tax=Sphingobacterium suaedae TaxID=1686402 RepID=A0ABW5KGL4_9SPHI
MTNTTLKVKVCGMRDDTNIQSLAQLPIDYMGFIFYEKSKRHVDHLPYILLPPTIKKVGVFVDASETCILDKIQAGIEVVQLHGQEPPALCKQLQESGVEVIKAFGIHSTVDWTKLADYQHAVDYFLFDTSDPEHGGTGRAFDWNQLKEYQLPVPYFLSGGLSLENLPAVLQLADHRLVGVDLNSKFETAPALKDINQIKKALKIINHE